MRHLAIILAAGLAALTPAAPVSAQGFGAAPQAAPGAEVAVWLQLAARRTRAEAEALAAEAASGPLSGLGVPVVMPTPSGWFAVSLGPYPSAEAEAMRAALLREGLVPADSFLVAVGMMPDPSVRLAPRSTPRPQASPLAEQHAAEAEKGATPPGGGGPLRQGIGVVVEAGGGILAPAAVVLGCEGLETSTGQPLSVIVGDAAAGLALLRPVAADGAMPAAALPPGPLTLRASADLAAGATVLARVMAYPGRLAPMMTLPAKVVEVIGADQPALRLRIEAQAADAGAPLWDETGALAGILRAPRADIPGSWALPPVLPAADILVWLDQVAGVRPAPSIEGGQAGIAAAEAATLRVLCVP